MRSFQELASVLPASVSWLPQTEPSPAMSYGRQKRLPCCPCTIVLPQLPQTELGVVMRYRHQTNCSRIANSSLVLWVSWLAETRLKTKDAINVGSAKNKCHLCHITQVIVYIICDMLWGPQTETQSKYQTKYRLQWEKQTNTKSELNWKRNTIQSEMPVFPGVSMWRNPKQRHRGRMKLAPVPTGIQRIEWIQTPVNPHLK